jgi:tRNA (cytidine/uridine-2'-O-)-methyltransferase
MPHYCWTSLRRKSVTRLKVPVANHLDPEPNTTLNVVLYQPEIPPNTGNVIRLCANTGVSLHLVGPLGFTLDDARLRRAGLDYREFASVRSYPDWSSWLEQNAREADGGSRLWAYSTRGHRSHTDVHYRAGDCLLFGPETRGLPQDLLDEVGPERTLRLPMAANSRSLNLSNAVAVAVYEALRQTGFSGLR